MLGFAMPIIGTLMLVPVAASLGTLAGLITDFGLTRTAENIRLNPRMFADQYADVVVRIGWTCVAVVVVSAAIVGVEWIRRLCKPPTKGERQVPASPDQPGS